MSKVAELRTRKFPTLLLWQPFSPQEWRGGALDRSLMAHSWVTTGRAIRLPGKLSARTMVLPFRGGDTAAKNFYFVHDFSPNWTGGLSNILTWRGTQALRPVGFHMGGKHARPSRNMWGTYTGVLATTNPGRGSGLG
jgi:hypothetical protein